MQPVIEVRDVVNRFGSQSVHDGVSFDVFPGEIFGVVGGSGTRSFVSFDPKPKAEGDRYGRFENYPQRASVTDAVAAYDRYHHDFRASEARDRAERRVERALGVRRRVRSLAK